MRNSVKILLLACTSLISIGSFAAGMTPRELIGEVGRLRGTVGDLRAVVAEGDGLISATNSELSSVYTPPIPGVAGAVRDPINTKASNVVAALRAAAAGGDGGHALDVRAAIAAATPALGETAPANATDAVNRVLGISRTAVTALVAAEKAAKEALAAKDAAVAASDAKAAAAKAATDAAAAEVATAEAARDEAAAKAAAAEAAGKDGIEAIKILQDGPIRSSMGALNNTSGTAAGAAQVVADDYVAARDAINGVISGPSGGISPAYFSTEGTSPADRSLGARAKAVGAYFTEISKVINARNQTYLGDLTAWLASFVGRAVPGALGVIPMGDPLEALPILFGNLELEKKRAVDLAAPEAAAAKEAAEKAAAAAIAAKEAADAELEEVKADAAAAKEAADAELERVRAEAATAATATAAKAEADKAAAVAAAKAEAETSVEARIAVAVAAAKHDTISAIQTAVGDISHGGPNSFSGKLRTAITTLLTTKAS